MIKPSNIKGKTFDTEKNGYRQADVSEFLSKVAEDYNKLLNANQESETKIIKLVEKINEYRADEDAIATALVTAQKEANRILNDAKTKAKDMVENAKTEQIRLAEQSAAECERIVNEHKEKCAQLIKENTEATEKKIQELRDSYNTEKKAYEQLKKEVTYFKSNLTELYKNQLQLIMEIPAVETTDEAEDVSDSNNTEEQSNEPSESSETDESTEEFVETNYENDKEHIDKVLNTGSFDPVIPKESLNDLKFGNNN